MTLNLRLSRSCALAYKSQRGFSVRQLGGVHGTPRGKVMGIRQSVYVLELGPCSVDAGVLRAVHR